MATMNGSITDHARRVGPQSAFLAKRLGRLVGIWLTRRRERLALAELDNRLLRDIGIDRLTAEFEADRPFWEGRKQLRRSRG